MNDQKIIQLIKNLKEEYLLRKGNGAAMEAHRPIYDSEFDRFIEHTDGKEEQQEGDSL